ncbi:MAG TPA: hypothetical protein VJZ27_03875, partial [Aggregatilineales bacterium]|nr:hypothetical protein [Aggregatilineales bacterium]
METMQTPSTSPQAEQFSEKTIAHAVINFMMSLARLREFALIVLIIAVGIALELYTGRFVTERNFNAISLGIATSAIMVFGMTT